MSGTWLKRTWRVEQPGWERVFPRCQDRDCHPSGRTWRRIWRRRAGLWLQGLWYCTPQCFENAAQRAFSRALVSTMPAQAVVHRIPLGLLMLSRGQFTNRQLRTALEAQRSSGRGRIGQWLEDLGFATETQVTAALGLQWACPVLPTSTLNEAGACADMLPHLLVDTFRMLPIRFNPATRTLYIAFSEGVDYPLLWAIEQMLDCHTAACLLGHSAMDQALRQLCQGFHPRDIMFESRRDIAEMAHITCGYALKLGGQHVRIAGCGDYVWVRIQSEDQSIANLLFHCRGEVKTEAHNSSNTNQSLTKKFTIEHPAIAAKFATR